MCFINIINDPIYFVEQKFYSERGALCVMLWSELTLFTIFQAFGGYALASMLFFLHIFLNLYAPASRYQAVKSMNFEFLTT